MYISAILRSALPPAAGAAAAAAAEAEVGEMTAPGAVVAKTPALPAEEGDDEEEEAAAAAETEDAREAGIDLTPPAPLCAEEEEAEAAESSICFTSIVVPGGMRRDLAVITSVDPCGIALAEKTTDVSFSPSGKKSKSNVSSSPNLARMSDSTAASEVPLNQRNLFVSSPYMIVT